MFGTWKFYKCFLQIRGENLVLKKMFNFLSFFVLLYVSGDFKQKKIVYVKDGSIVYHPLAFPLPVQKCLELGNFTSVFCKLGGKI